MPKITIRERNNPNAVHGVFDSLDGAERWIRQNAPEYCRKGYFSDKTLTPADFVPYVNGAPIIYQGCGGICVYCGSNFRPCDCVVDL
jgi:hypothetical protein